MDKEESSRKNSNYSKASYRDKYKDGGRRKGRSRSRDRYDCSDDYKRDKHKRHKESRSDRENHRSKERHKEEDKYRDRDRESKRYKDRHKSERSSKHKSSKKEKDSDKAESSKDEKLNQLSENTEEKSIEIPLPNKLNTNSSLPKGRRPPMIPMTKEEYDKQQSIIREVYDPLSGRTRLIRGDGEVIERIVTKEKQREINKLATTVDGLVYQSTVKKLN